VVPDLLVNVGEVSNKDGESLFKEKRAFQLPDGSHAGRGSAEKGKVFVSLNPPVW